MQIKMQKVRETLSRPWVKNAAIIFLVVMLLLTFFSNTIRNRSLMEVEVAQPTMGTIDNRIRGTAEAEANNAYQIESDALQEILAVFVREGQEVEVGDRLFELAISDEDPLQAAIRLLNERRVAHQQALLAITGGDFAMQNENVRAAREDLQRAQSTRAALGTINVTAATAQIRVNTATAALAALQAELDFVDALDSRSARIGAQVRAVEAIVAQMIALTGFSYADYVARIAELEAERDRLTGTGSDALLQGVIEQLNELNRHAAQMASLNLEFTNAERAMHTAATNARSALLSEMNTAQTDLTTAEATLARALSIEAADETVRAAQRALNAVLIALASEQQQLSVAEAQKLLDLQLLEEEIAELETRVERLQAGTEPTETEDGAVILLARHAGVIANVTAVVGQMAEPGLPLAEILIDAMGYTAELTITTAQAGQIHVGSEVDVQSMNWGAGISGRVAVIRPNPVDPGNQRIVEIALEGNVTAGEQLQLAVVLPPLRHDTIVPRTAVHQDAAGDHIYVVHSRTSPLGTRYQARRVDVIIEGEDETQAAVRGDIGWFDNIIIRSSGTIADRDYVRLAT